MRVLIVDDEPGARRRLRLLLAELGEELGAELAGEAADGVEALAKAASLRPDVLLLDISMPEVDGFDVVRHLPEPRPLIVFQTAYDEYALEAFDHEALDYMVKPVTRKRLKRALGRAARRIAEGGHGQIPRAVLERVRDALATGARGRPRLLVRAGRGHRLLPLAEITRFTAGAGAVYAHTAEKRHLTDYTLTELEARTVGAFVRVSRSVLVHLEAVERIVPGGDGSASLTLTDGTEVRVSRRRLPAVRQALGV